MAQLIKAVIDTQKNTYRSIGQVSTGDDLELELEVKMNGQPIEFINPECELLIKKSDNNRIRQTKDILYQDGKFKIKVDEQGVTYPGIVTCQLVTKENGRVSTCLFYFNVGTSLDREVLQSISKVETLEQLDEYVATAFANLDEYEKRIIVGDETIRKLNNDMSEAEKIRDAAELERQETFKTLKENMNEAITNLESSINLSNLNEKERSEVFNALKSNLESIKQDLINLNTNVESEEEKRVQAEIDRVNKTLEIIGKLESTNDKVTIAEAERVTEFNNIKSELTSLKEALTTINNIANSNEEIRKTNENGRVAAEQQRVIDFEKIKSDNTNLGTTLTKKVDDKLTEIQKDNTTFKQEINEQYANIDIKVKDVDKRVQVIEQNGLGGGNANIDDNTISKTSTWSSEKIENFVHTNDDVVWSTVQGENLSIDYTKEGKLREVEIWGNTWQDDTDSKNLWNPIFYTKNQYGITGIAGKGYHSGDITGLKPNTSYTISIGKITVPATAYYRIGIGASDSSVSNSGSVKWVVSQNNGANETPNQLLNKYITNSTGEDGVLKVWLWNDKGASDVEWLFDVCENIQLEEGSVVTDYVDYHKADLSNIQHLGELYVDEEGQPILDSEGREQYKIEVESINKNLIKPNMEMSKGTYHETTGVFTSNSNGNGRCTKEFIKVPTPGTYACFINTTINLTWFRVFTFDKDYNFIDCPISLLGTTYSQTFSIPDKAKFIKLQWLNGENLSTGDVYLTKSDTKLNEFIPHQSNKATLLLPCQLMKVGDVADRLYWDSEKKKYVIEKNVIDINVTGDEQWNSYLWEGINKGYYTSDIYSGNTGIESISPNPKNYLTNWGKIYSRSEIQNIDETSLAPGNNNTNNYLVLRGRFNNIVELQTHLRQNKLMLKYVNTPPQLIETNITEQILLPCYKDKTHLFVIGGIDGGIKAKVPLDGGKAIQSLSARNVALSLENEELKETNATQDILINTTMLATDEMFTMLEPLLSEVAQTLSLERSVSKMVDLYVAMVMRGLKTIEQVPTRYREEVREILAKLEK